MSYASTADVRTLTGLTTDDIGNTDLETIIDYAQKQLINDLNVRVVNGELEIDTTYDNIVWVPNIPIADTDFDSSIDKTDLTVYSWTDSEDENTKGTVAISSINSESGRVVLSSDLSSDIEKVTGDYSYYLGRTPDFDLIKEATSYLSGYLAMVKVKGKLPPKYSIGRLRITEDVPGRVYIDEYRRLIKTIKNKMFSRG